MRTADSYGSESKNHLFVTNSTGFGVIAVFQRFNYYYCVAGEIYGLMGQKKVSVDKLDSVPLDHV